MIILTVFLLIICGYVQSSGIHPVAPSVVTAASSQYFERTFNRLIAVPPPVIPVAPPLIPVAPAPPVFQSVLPVATPPVVVEATRTTSIPVDPTNPPRIPNDPNIAIAIATANAAPVATFLLPPYPFGFPPSFGLPQGTDFNKESTTPTTTTVQMTTTEREQEVTTPVPSNIDNSFAQALPSNDNVNFQLYGPPLPSKPQKLTTSVEVVPVPLTYIAPPPLQLHHHHHHHHGHHHQALRTPHIHTFIPKPVKIIVRPISRPLRIRTVRVPARLVAHAHLSRRASAQLPRNLQTRPKDPEPTTFRPLNRPVSKPPRR